MAAAVRTFTAVRESVFQSERDGVDSKKRDVRLNAFSYTELPLRPAEQLCPKCLRPDTMWQYPKQFIHTVNIEVYELRCQI